MDTTTFDQWLGVEDLGESLFCVDLLCVWSIGGTCKGIGWKCGCIHIGVNG